LSVFPNAVGGLLWRSINACVFLGALTWWSVTVLPVNLTSRHRAVLFILVAPLAVGSLNNGQSNPLILGLLLTSGAAVATRRWNVSSICLAIACLFKIYPLAVALLLAVRYPRQLGVRLAITLAIGLALPFMLSSPDYVVAQIRDWIECLRNDDRQTWPLPGGYRDLRMLFRLWLTPLNPTVFLGLQLMAGALIAALCLRRRSNYRDACALLGHMMGLGCCWMTVFGPATESSTYMLVAPALAGALVEACCCRRTDLATVLLASYGLFLASQVALWFPTGTRFINLGTQPLAGLLLFGCLVMMSCRSMSETGEIRRSACTGRIELPDTSTYHQPALDGGGTP
jgi:hypothetical protein